FAVIFRRNTVYKALVGQELRINCTVVFCSSLKTVSWYKFENKSIPIDVTNITHIKTEWKMLNELEGISFLVFRNILRSDSGDYQCRSGRDASHIINVTVYGECDLILTHETYCKLISTLCHFHSFSDFIFKYPFGFLQYMAIPMAQQPFPPATLQPSPRGSPAVPPSRRSTRRKRPTEPPSARDGAQVCGQESEDRERQRNTAEEESSSVVYAALDHQLPPRAAPRTRRLVEESSEYAAIRVA
uniref:Ig-like domain-containing protein n=1 Tax=Amphiprion ocellaris TaxID=80972 RepID=A0A3Q1CD77_AMPOC